MKFKVGDHVRIITKEYGDLWYNKVGTVKDIYTNEQVSIDVEHLSEKYFGAFFERELKKISKQEYFLEVL